MQNMLYCVLIYNINEKKKKGVVEYNLLHKSFQTIGEK